jgi:hypothetical protein
MSLADTQRHPLADRLLDGRLLEEATMAADFTNDPRRHAPRRARRPAPEQAASPGDRRLTHVPC